MENNNTTRRAAGYDTKKKAATQELNLHGAAALLPPICPPTHQKTLRPPGMALVKGVSGMGSMTRTSAPSACSTAT